MIFFKIFVLSIVSYTLGEEWTIHVYTGNQRFAGTDNYIFIRLYNSKDGYSSEYELNHNNWIFGRYAFPLKNLFERGAHERFRVSTNKIGTPEIIHVRHENFPLFQSDWLLNRIVIERNRDSTKFTFPCQCWLGKERPNITISVLLSDLPSNDETIVLKSTAVIISIFSLLVSLIICLICYVHKYYRPRRFSSVQTHQATVFIDRYHPQLLEPSAPSLFLEDTIDTRKNIRKPIRINNNTRVTIVRPITITSTDEPPAYTDLFPN